MPDLTFDFVSSLTFREKAYFKRFSQTYSSKENKNYLKIYSFLEKQKAYDEKALKEFFSAGVLCQNYYLAEFNGNHISTLRDLGVPNT